MKPELTIYYTSDTHGYVFPTNFIDDKTRPVGLMGMIPQFIKDGNTLILDGGDTTQGSPLTYYCRKQGLPGPMSRVMNAAGYDYVTLGNHDFNYGYEALYEYLSMLNARCLCANVRDKAGRLPIAPYAVHTLENGLRVGIVGIVTPWIMRWEREETLAYFEITDPLDAARKALGLLRGRVDYTICLYHGGVEKDLNTGRLLSDTDENIACCLCEELDFDLLLTGHQHISMENRTYCGTHLAQPPANATHFLKAEASGKGSITSRLMPSDAENLPPLYEEMQPLKAALDAWLDAPIGKLDKPLWPEGKLQMALYGTPIANLFNQVQLDASRADISCTSLGNEVRGFSDRVTVRDVVATYIYPNTLVVLQVDGRTLKAALENCASYFAISPQGEVSISRDFLEPKVAHYNYDFFAGMDYTFDLSRPVGQRVTVMIFCGEPIRDDQKFTLCMNNYRATGVGGYEAYLSCPRVREINTEMSELLLDYLAKQECVTVSANSPLTVLLP